MTVSTATLPAQPSHVVKVAIIGCGEIAMNTHLPTLGLCSHIFKTEALVDISEQALAHCSAKFNVPKTFTSVDDMLAACPEIELVMIMNANEYHAIHAVAALNAGKNVFIEKPMAITLESAADIEAARAANNKVVFVGYMRRYAPAFLRMKERLAKVAEGDISFIRVRDIIGQNEFFVDQSGTFPIKFTDFPVAAGAERAKLSALQHAQALGPKAENRLDQLTWMLLNGLASHDLSALRELVGMPQRILSATRTPDGRFVTVVMQYPGFVAFYEMGIDGVRKFDAHIEVHAKDTRFKVSYDTPYVKGLPITYSVLRSDENGDHVEEVVRPTYEDAFTAEYRALHAAITEGAEVKTSALDATEDLKLFGMIMDAMVTL